MDAETGTRERVRLAALVAALVATIVFCNTVPNGLVYDDHPVIEANEAAHRPLDLRTIFLTPSWAGHTSSYRPLTLWTLAVNYAAGGAQPAGYHLVNVVAHALVSVLVVLLGAALGLSPLAAGVAGCLFAAHAIHTEAVASVIGRAEIMAAGFSVLLLILQRRASAAGWPTGAIAGVALAYAMALLSKENSIVLVGLVPLADLLLTDGGSIRVFLRHTRGRRALVYGLLFTVTVAYLVLRVTTIGSLTVDREAVTVWMNPTATAPVVVRVLTALKVQALALWLLVAPFRLSADYSPPTIPLVTSVTEWGALAGIAVALGLLVLAQALWRRSGVALFSLALALLTYALVSNLVFPIGTIFAERLLYLPSVGFCLALGVGVDAAGRHRPAWTMPTVASLAALGVAWGISAAWHNLSWRDDLSFGQALVESAPRSAHAHHVLGSTQANLGMLDAALVQFDLVLQIDPNYLGSLFNAGLIHWQRGRPADGLALLRRVIDLEPRHLRAWWALATIEAQLGDYATALDAADHAIAIAPREADSHCKRAWALRGLQRRPEAEAEFGEALRLTPDFPDALGGLGLVASDEGAWPSAAGAFERLVAVAPSLQANRLLLQAYRYAGRDVDAERLRADLAARYPDEPAFSRQTAARDAG